MNTLKLLLGGTALGVILIAFRDRENREWIFPRGGAEEPIVDETEPILGYDGMDRDTLLDWLERADPDPRTLRRIRAYESNHRAREPVLAAVDERLG